MTLGNRLLGLLLLAVLLVFALVPSALAVDGTILINQNTSVNGLPGCTHSGFPIIICNSGSYRLSGNLTISDVNTDGIDINVDNVTFDLNGFAISGPVRCARNGNSCSATGSGIGINSTNDNITVTNGTVRGMGNSGIQLLGDGTLVDGVHADQNGGPFTEGAAGIIVTDGIVTRCTAWLNWGNGIDGRTLSTISLNSVGLNRGNGITLGGVVSNNRVTLNKQDGIHNALLAVNNGADGNHEFGISLQFVFQGYMGNVMSRNGSAVGGGGGPVQGGTSMGHNLCDDSKNVTVNVC